MQCCCARALQLNQPLQDARHPAGGCVAGHGGGGGSGCCMLNHPGSPHGRALGSTTRRLLPSAPSPNTRPGCMLLDGTLTSQALWGLSRAVSVSLSPFPAAMGEVHGEAKAAHRQQPESRGPHAPAMSLGAGGL